MRFEVKTSIISLSILSAGHISAALSIKIRDNPLGIDYDPAPPPELGPALSAGALRNPAYLPAEIGGIVGAYVLVVFVIGIALLSIGRRLRLQTTVAKVAREVEILPAPATYMYPSPISPGSGATQKNFSWPSPEKTDRNPYIFPSTNRSPISPTIDSSVDLRIVEANKENLNRGLEDLYAHVMAQEEAKAAGKPPPEVSLPRDHFPMQQLPPASSQRQLTKEKPKPLGLNVDKPQKTQSRASSIISSLKSPRKSKGLKGLQISSPIPTPLSQTFPRDYASDEEPLSPISYNLPPPPPIPKDQVPYTHSRNNSSNASTDPSPVSPGASIAEQLAYAHPRQYQHHSRNPSQTSVASRDINVGLPSNPARKAALPSLVTRTATPPRPQQQSTASNPPSNNNSTRTLPFRAFDPPAGLASPSFSNSTKTTVLERTAPALLSPGLKTPWTAGVVPYSPYQPQTPMTPFSPRLVTKEERKMKKKLEGRAPVLEMIKSEDELWDSAY